MHKFILFIILVSSSFAHAGQPVGFYSNGSLENARELPYEGEGYMRLYLADNRGWGSETLINLLIATGRDMNQLYPGEARLQVEDLSTQNGGDISGHGSHENGLDADLTYYRVDGLEHDPQFGQKYSDSLVISGQLSPNFHLRKNWELMKALHRNGDVNRIFVDQVIKNKLCEYSKSIGEYKNYINVLRSLRHVNNHADHLHVRLRCPPDAGQCRDQALPPAGSGCP